MSTVRNILEQFFKQFEASYETLNVIELSRTALLHNFDLIKEKFRDQHMIPVLKANAYGHGLEQTVRMLEDREVSYVAVDSYHEALQVRAMSDFDVLVMGAIMPENFSKIDFRHIAYVVQDASVLNVLTNLRRPVRIHLEFDTGMNRQGFDAQELKDVLSTLKDNPHIELDGVMSHFYDAAGKSRASVNEQIKKFDAIVAKIMQAGFKPPYVHIAKTAGIGGIKGKYVNTVRPGSGLYGVNPFKKEHPLADTFAELRPVLTFYSKLIKIQELKEGEGVSYGHSHKLKKPKRVGVIPVGYFEGVPESLSNDGTLRYRGTATPILGTVNMNHTMVDVTDCKAKLWDRVEVISNEPGAPNSLNSWWEQKGLYPLVSLTRLSSDIRRVIVE